MNEKITKLSTKRAVFFADVQGAAARLSIPKPLCELYNWPFGATIGLQVERRGQVFKGRFAMSSGYEIVPSAADTLLRKVLKPGSRVKVTVRP